MIVKPCDNPFLLKNDRDSIKTKTLPKKNKSLRSSRENDLENKLNPKVLKHDVVPPFRIEPGLKPELSTHRDTFRNPGTGTFLFWFENSFQIIF